MQAASPFLAAQDPPQPQQAAGDLWDFAEACLQHTAGAAHEARVATPAEISQAIDKARESHAKQKPADFIEVLARVQGHDEEHISKAVLELGDKIALTVSPYAPLVPFAGKLIAPSAFYDAFDHIHKVARVLLSPVIYAEDTDAIGTASINPIASAMLSDEIRSSVHKRFGIRPFVTIARLDYESWAFLTRKHFEL
ncbi:MAG: hypothetical protein EOP85_05805 [Verrucomicrobiaceae bacterium]|nr:MAG: hypothetical protein EOP85_05805 [Verrucomicrobiaceae bacterium]